MALTSEQNINENALDDQFIVLTTNSADVLDAIAFDTVTDGTDVTSYTVHTDTTIDIDGTDTDVLKISDDTWKVKVTETNSRSATYKLDVTVDPFAPVAGLTYVMTLDDGTDTIAVVYNNGWNFTGLSYDTNYAVALYVYGTTATLDSGFTNYDDTTTPVTDGSVFTFRATAEETATP